MIIGIYYLYNLKTNKNSVDPVSYTHLDVYKRQDYGKVAEIRYGKLQALDKEIEDTQKQLRDMQGDKAMIKEEVDAEVF